ncbi:ribosome biogenesis GTPase A, putative [Plasmodium berghei]|uniref:Ribosome biogenesis GTPase A, putative n=2 Tax=Plasmodium berghei TaxID=5821 RepID=A0A509AMK3_PLABA|nr:ribosome biogenesis GTPase A, putative [Plasmodium berghei ANKA]CXI50067.1 ribosome biogenesis GTPase A, putative [Plasmodium berghei]SCL94167.1 ribosome biogenesis GTPase A, putative [Plasmodium berghei]SCM15956.1 ribosome biogenesis GTPase A, putative [Plasmodium berghei]SCM17752.1 ribosome biogenesis GTPase A, putative [Plasmodium berghei]SCN25956.1 ribosome biogenesis GTPase A, putative [Plasmodium berghei]|eukprot:XP_034421881.1 ribosome biogenesis GTPase A, putative [Plasmodium berghei ANKA]
MFFPYLMVICLIHKILCIQLKIVNENIKLEDINASKPKQIRRFRIYDAYLKKNIPEKKLYFLKKFNKLYKNDFKRKKLRRKERKENKTETEKSNWSNVGKYEKEVANTEFFHTFDEYFNKRSKEDYEKLEAGKLKILTENANTYKDEIRKIMEKSYKSEYEKLKKEDEEDSKISQDVHENLKVTFVMNKNIDNFLFTQYSYMINKLKEKSEILKSLKNVFNNDNNNNGSNTSDNIGKNNNDKICLDEKTEKYSNEEKNAKLRAINKPEDAENALEFYKKGSNKENKLIEEVNFFKPKKGYAEEKRVSTFSDQMFANVKIENKNLLIKGEEYDTNDGGLKLEKGEEVISNYNNEDEGTELFLKNNVSVLELFKENVKASLKYKKENIIKNNLNENLLCGRVKVHWFPKFMKRIIMKIPDYIKISDIIIEVRNGIIPFVFDDLYALNMFDIYTNKPKIIVYTNCDRASLKGTEEWGNYYRRKLYWSDKKFNRNIKSDMNASINSTDNNPMKKSAVIFVDAKNGKKEIIVLKKLINRLCERVIESKRKKGIHNYKVKCIFLGLPNVGKSALINKILEIKKTKSYDLPGLTKNIQMYSTKKYELIDTPGIIAHNLYKLRERVYDKNNRILDEVYNKNNKDYSIDNIVNIKNYNSYMHIENNIYLLALCNHISPKMYDIYNIAEVLIQNIYNTYLYDNEYVDLKKIINRYQINFVDCINSQGQFSAYHFIQKLARDRFNNDLNQASMRIVSDFRKNYLGKMTLNYPIYFNKKTITLKRDNQFVNSASDRYVGW